MGTNYSLEINACLEEIEEWCNKIRDILQLEKEAEEY